ncbi:MAG: putative monooxygenase [Acidimicrobiales bacterium]|nr:MAG: putative monooxygenase [Acidimicrobiales bacterium]
MADSHLRFGIFLPPIHPPGQNPTLALQRDLQLIEHLDRLGFDEAWIGEHHSAGHEIISSPEIFIAAAAERTRRIMLGTGVVSLPYHHPFMVAERIVLLDHLTRGRVMLGVGPGALPSDAAMLGIDAASQRDRMDESLGVIMRLLRGETVDHESDWFRLVDARLQLAPFSRPHPEVAVAAMVSPSGPRTAGRHGVSLLSIGATQQAGFDALGTHWSVWEETARHHGHTPDRSRWRVLTQMHLAPTRKKAEKEVRYGLPDFLRYFAEVAALPIAPAGDVSDISEHLRERALGVIGTPDDAIELIERLLEQSGGFGTLLLFAHDWADPEATKRSYELFATRVMPYFQGQLDPPQTSMLWTAERREKFMADFGAGVAAAIQRHQQDRERWAAGGDAPDDQGRL